MVCHCVSFQGLVCSLNAMLEHLSLAEDVYSLGPTSRMVAVDLANFTWAKTRRKVQLLFPAHFLFPCLHRTAAQLLVDLHFYIIVLCQTGSTYIQYYS